MGAPPGVAPAALTVHNDPAAGQLVVHVRPADHTSGAQAMTLLAAMGKDLEMMRHRSLTVHDLRRLCRVWLRAHDIRTVALCGAQVLNRRNLTWVLDLLVAVPQVLLVCDHGTATQLPGHARAASPATSWAAVQTALAARPPTESKEPADRPAYGLDDLPTGDFLTFRADCLRHLSPEAFDELDQLYQTVFRTASELDADARTVLEHLRTASTKARSTGDLLVVIRATQAALFRRGHHLKVHRDRLLGTLAALVHVTPRSEHYTALQGFVRPAPAAICALHLTGLAPEAMLALTVADVDGALAGQGPLASAAAGAARLFLAAQLLWRQQEQQAAPDEPFLPIGRLEPAKILAGARRDLDLPVDAGNVHAATHQNTRRYTRLGLTLQPLT